jgi:hypothetical protein
LELVADSRLSKETDHASFWKSCLGLLKNFISAVQLTKKTFKRRGDLAQRLARLTQCVGPGIGIGCLKPAPIRKVCRQFVALSRNMDPLDGNDGTIDGTSEAMFMHVIIKPFSQKHRLLAVTICHESELEQPLYRVQRL